MDQPESIALPGTGRVSLRQSIQSPAGQRMGAIAASSMLVSFYMAATDVILPLWATRSMGMSNAQWAQLRSLRMMGIALGVILLGALSDRLGLRRITIFSFAAMGAISVFLGLGRQEAIWMIMPFFGAFLSTTMINLNTMTQDVTARRPGLANTIYRGMGAVAAIPAPIAVTFLAVYYHGYSPVFFILAFAMALAVGILFLHPAQEVAPMGHWRHEAVQFTQVYRTALRQRELVVFLLLSQLWLGLLSGILTFAAIYFTRSLKMSEPTFGALSGLAALLSVAGIVAVGFLLDGVSLRKLYACIAIAAGVGAFAMGVGRSTLLCSAGFLLIVPLLQISMAPTSMWISRVSAEETRIAAFSLYKVVTALCGCLVMLLLSFLEARMGIRLLFLSEGVLAVVAGGLFFLLPEPEMRPKT